MTTRGIYTVFVDRDSIIKKNTPNNWKNIIDLIGYDIVYFTK